MKEKVLRKYPSLPSDPFMDFEVTRIHGRGFSTFSIGELKMPYGEIVVYTLNLREGDKVVNTSSGFKKICETDLDVQGYKVEKTFFQPSKIKKIPEEKRKNIETALKGEYKEKENMKLGSINFAW